MINIIKKNHTGISSGCLVEKADCSYTVSLLPLVTSTFSFPCGEVYYDSPWNGKGFEYLSYIFYGIYFCIPDKSFLFKK